MTKREKLSHKDIYKVVNRYIGVNGGYLGDFSYRTHYEFYLEYCDLEIDPNLFEGTTRERFIKILTECNSEIQATILEGLLSKYPIGSSEHRTSELYNDILEMIKKCRSDSIVESPSLKISSSVVDRAIKDAETLISLSGATSGVDRIHTSLHGYLEVVCDNSQISYDEDSSITRLFKLIRKSHPSFGNLGKNQDTIDKITNSMSSIIDALNPARNKGSVAHPNKSLLLDAEAMLVINAARTILHYLNNKISIQDENNTG